MNAHTIYMAESTHISDILTAGTQACIQFSDRNTTLIRLHYTCTRDNNGGG